MENKLILISEQLKIYPNQLDISAYSNNLKDQKSNLKNFRSPVLNSKLIQIMITLISLIPNYSLDKLGLEMLREHSLLLTQMSCFIL